MTMIMPNRFIQVKMKDPIRTIYLVETLVDRDNIPSTARYEGMVVYVKENKGNYQLQGGVENDYWGVFGDVSVIKSTIDGEPSGAKTVGNIVEISRADYEIAKSNSELVDTTFYLITED